MALQSFTVSIGALRDVNNNDKNYVSGEAIYVKTIGGTFAPIFRDLAGTSEIAQDGLANQTNEKGQFTFFVDAGDYILEYQNQSTQVTIVGPDYFNNRVEETVNQIIIDTATSRGFRVVGDFASGFTYELANDVAVDGSGNYWVYADVNALPVVVAAGTTPSAPTYTQTTFSQASAVTTTAGINAQEFIDNFELKIFQSPTDNLTKVSTFAGGVGVVYEVRKTSDNSLATIYSDKDGVTSIPQNGTANVSNGDAEAVFYIAYGDYAVTINAVSAGFEILTQGVISIPAIADKTTPILTAEVSGFDDITYWASHFSKNLMISDGGAVLNNAASGTKDGNNNTGFGLGAFTNATTAYASAAFGYNSLAAATTGNSNSAFGYQAGLKLTTGNNNSLFGTDAGFNLTTGNNNTLFGRHVFFDNTELATGDNNTCVGYDIALPASTINNMVIIGAQAQRNGATSARSVTIGSSVAQASSEVNDSVIIGRQAAQNVSSTVANDVLVGDRVNENALTTANNAIIGSNSFFTAAQPPVSSERNSALGGRVGTRVYGVNNTLIGYRAGAYATDTELNNTVLIGYRAGDGTAVDGDFIIANSQVSSSELVKGNFTTKAMRIEAAALTLRNLPTVGTGASGTLWNDAGTIKVVP